MRLTTSPKLPFSFKIKAVRKNGDRFRGGLLITSLDSFIRRRKFEEFVIVKRSIMR